SIDMQFFLLLVCFLPTISGLKFLSYNPVYGRSHCTFMHALHEALIDAGHEVHVITPIIDTRVKLEETRAKVFIIPQSPESIAYETGIEADMITNSWVSEGVMGALGGVKHLMAAWHGQCNFTLQYPGFMEQLAKEKYDAAFTEPVCFCGYGIFDKLGIKNIASTLSTASSEGTFRFTGAPSVPSYVPGILGKNSDRMTFVERMGNSISGVLPYFFWSMLQNPFDEMFKQHFGENASTSEEILKKTSYFFLNSEPITDFPRVITHKIIDIGGISVSGGYKPLNETWSKILDLRKKTVLVSFGSVAKSYLMPDSYKQTIRKTIQKFPEVTFIWKYEKPEHRISEGIDNMIESTWVPQNDMLHDPRLSLFITHCGQGSTIESTTAGVPLIVIPVLGDQQRNAQTIKRIGTGVVLEKTILAEGETLEKTIREVLENEEYSIKAKLVGEMIRNRPFTARETFVRNMEFMAKYGPLRMFDHYGTQLNFLQYYCLDVFAFLTSIVLIFLGLIFICVRAVFRRCFMGSKKKIE
ncbi:ugt-19, partial [Pristionchus pacificus]